LSCQCLPQENIYNYTGSAQLFNNFIRSYFELETFHDINFCIGLQHSVHTFGTALMPPQPSCRKGIYHRLKKNSCPSDSEVSVCLNLRDVTPLCQFSGHSNRNLDLMVLLLHQSKGYMNNFTTEAASAIKGRIAHEDHVLLKKLSRV
jgi:hypothetical protein